MPSVVFLRARIAEVFNADAAADEQQQLRARCFSLAAEPLLILAARALAAELRSCPRTCFRI
jgi:hypothetical protein